MRIGQFKAPLMLKKKGGGPSFKQNPKIMSKFLSQGDRFQPSLRMVQFNARWQVPMPE